MYDTVPMRAVRTPPPFPALTGVGCVAAAQLAALEDGRVLLSDKPATPDTVVKNGDYIIHFVHRHEPPVLDTPLEIALDTDDVVRGHAPDHAAGMAHLLP